LFQRSFLSELRYPLQFISVWLSFQQTPDYFQVPAHLLSINRTLLSFLWMEIRQIKRENIVHSQIFRSSSSHPLSLSLFFKCSSSLKTGLSKNQYKNYFESSPDVTSFLFNYLILTARFLLYFSCYKSFCSSSSIFGIGSGIILIESCMRFKFYKLIS